MDRIVSALPQPKRPNTTAKAAAAKKEEGAKAAEPTKKSTGPLTVIPEKKLPPNETNESALKSATAWSNF